MNDNLSTILKKEMERLEQEKQKNLAKTNVNKMFFIEEIKNNIGPLIKESINNPDRHNPKKLSFWKRIKKVLLGCY